MLWQLSPTCSLVSRNAVVLPRCPLEALVGPSLLPAWSGGTLSFAEL